MSNYVTIALASQAATPTKPTVDRDLSTLNSVFIEWTEGTLGDIPIDGYRLWMIELATGTVSLVYDGANNARVFYQSIQNLETGAYYSFYVQAVNFNGWSLESEASVFSVCLQPTHIDSPDYVSSTKTSFTLRWTKPEYTGGCPILSYAVHMNDGLGGSIFTEVDNASIANKPYLTEHTFAGLSLTSNFYKFKVEVINEIGSAISLPSRF